MRMGTTTLAFEQSAWDELAEGLGEPDEKAWVLIARLVEGEDPSTNATLLVREAVPVPDSAYVDRRPDHLTIASTGWVPAFGKASDDASVPIFVHTHPGGWPRPSQHDEEVDGQLRTVAAVRTVLGRYGSLILGGSAESPSFTGRLYASGADVWDPIDRVRVAGDQLILMPSWPFEEVSPEPEIFDRQVRAFGQAGQRALRHLKVGVVGAGGTGSAVLEQLIRLGVGEVVAVDPDALTETNITRVYGSSLQDAGTPKVKIAAEHARRIGLNTKISPVEGSLLDKEVALSLVHCDIVFGCTDDHAGRTLLTRMPQALLQLLIDCGVTIDSRGGIIYDIFGRVSVVTPTSPCLVCMREVDPDRARSEQLPAEERQRRVEEGYAPELKTPDPAVVTFTTATAAFAVNEALSRLFGYSDARPANRLLLRMANRSMSRSTRTIQGGHRCGRPHLLASGSAEPFLDWGWSQ